MVRLEVIDYDIIERSAAEYALHSVQKLVRDRRVGAVKHCRFLVRDNVGIVRCALGHREKIFKVLYALIAGGDGKYSVRYFSYCHCFSPFFGSEFSLAARRFT